MRRLIAALPLLIAAPATAEPLTLMLGENQRGTAELVFQSDMEASDAFVLRTVGVGVPGSRVMLSIDRAPRDLVDRVLSEEECRFGDGPVMCEVEIAGGSQSYADLVEAFRAGLVAHLDVTDAGHSVMREDVSLEGFTAAFTGL